MRFGATKRQKELSRAQKRRDKDARREQRKRDKVARDGELPKDGEDPGMAAIVVGQEPPLEPVA